MPLMTLTLKFCQSPMLPFTSRFSLRLLHRSKMALSGGADRGSHSMDKSITLPPDEIFRNLENAKRFAIDIGTITRKLALLLTVCIAAQSLVEFARLGVFFT